MKQTLKFLFFAFSMLLLIEAAHAQAPQLFNYQGIARDVKGNPLSNQKMAIKLSVLPTADATVAEYEETQMVSTNEFGLYTLQIGNGTAVSGQMKNVKWETGNKYIKVAIDPKGGTDYVDAGTNQLLSVPYAIYADKAGTTANSDHDKTRSGAVSTSGAGTGTVNYLTKFTAANTIYNSQIFDNGTSIGIGTAAPSALSKLHMLTTTGNIEHIRMQNTNSTGFGKFLMYNDVAANYATFTKYGSTYPGGYPGIASLFPYANMLAFGNNLGPFLLANNGNVGIGIVTAGNTKLYFNAQQSTGYLGIGGSFVPAANVHFGNTSTGDTLRITNATTGHLATDGLEIRNTGNAASIMNLETSTLSLGSNNATAMTIAANNRVGIGVINTDEAQQETYNNTNPTQAKFASNMPLYLIGNNPMVGFNTRWNGGYTYGTTGYAAIQNFNQEIIGGMNFLTAPSGTAGTPATMTSRMAITNTGAIGINTTAPNPSYKLTVQPDGPAFIGGINVGDALDEYSFYAQKSGLFDAIYLSKTNASTSTPTLSVSSLSPNAYGSYISSNGMGLYSNAGAGAGVYSYSGKSYGIEATGDSLSAGYFHTGGFYGNSALIANGVLKGQYTGAGNFDVPGVYGVSQPASNYGYGVKGLGNYMGVRGDGNTGGFAGVYGGSGGATYAGYFAGNVTISGTIAKGAGTFKIDHPLDPENKYLYHSFVESPDMMNIYNGNIVTDANGDAIVTMPDYFDALNKEFRYQLTAIGSFAQAMISEEISGNTFKIKTNQPNVKISWQVTGIRHDKFADQNRVVAEVEKEAEFKGKYIHPTAWGMPENKGINYAIEHRDGQTITPEMANKPTDIKAMEQRAEQERQSVKSKRKIAEPVKRVNDQGSNAPSTLNNQ
jgi:hypothetical protein